MGKKTHHMTGRVDSGESEALRAARLARHMTVDVPLAQRERRKGLLARPLEREGPRLVPNPITDPVVRPDVDEHAHLARQQRADVVHRAVQVVSRCVERHSDCGRTGRELLGDVRVDSERRADIWAIKETGDDAKRRSVQSSRNGAWV